MIRTIDTPQGKQLYTLALWKLEKMMADPNRNHLMCKQLSDFILSMEKWIEPEPITVIGNTVVDGFQRVMEQDDEKRTPTSNG